MSLVYLINFVLLFSCFSALKIVCDIVSLFICIMFVTTVLWYITYVHIMYRGVAIVLLPVGRRRSKKDIDLIIRLSCTLHTTALLIIYLFFTINLDQWKETFFYSSKATFYSIISIIVLLIIASSNIFMVKTHWFIMSGNKWWILRGSTESFEI